MQATIYVTAKAMATVTALDGLDEGARDLLAWRPETDIRGNEGYYLNAESMQLRKLPKGADVAPVLSPADAAKYARHVSYPPELRGVVFSGATGLPKDYERILAYWSPLLMTADHDGAEHVQNLLNEYEVSQGDVLLSNGVVMCIENVLELIDGLNPDQYVEIKVPVLADFLGMEREYFDSDMPYSVSPTYPVECIFLRVRDILDSPNPDFIAITVLHTENWDSPFYL